VLCALANPIGSPRLREIVKPGETIAIVTSDVTRPCPTWQILPHILDELYAAGVKASDVFLVFALGSHRKHTDEEQKKLAGERAYSEIRCIDSDAGDVVRLGLTSRGTPVDLMRAVAEADRRICLGNIEYHYFAGYSGGAKAIMPGCSTRAAIQANHSRMLEVGAKTGNLSGNPVREDIEEAVRLCGVDFILNVVLDEHKNIVRAVAGDVTQAHRAGCAFLDSLYLADAPAAADIVIASQGGAPKDANLYQLQKALDNAQHAVKQGGVIILAGACSEGLGNRIFEEWMTSAPSPEALTERIRSDFQLGGHKAAAIAGVLQKANVYLVSEMQPDFVKSLFFTPFSTVQDALDAALAKLGANAKVLAIPYCGSVLPRVKHTEE
jgi:nickel-dependent lactate racemase